MQFLSIILLSIFASVIYGIIHDQITARICVEYFTIGHPPVFDTTDPTLLALGWGIIATWWVGLILGVPLAIAARAGSWPRLLPSQLVRPLGMMLAIVGILAAVAGGLLAIILLFGNGSCWWNRWRRKFRLTNSFLSSPICGCILPAISSVFWAGSYFVFGFSSFGGGCRRNEFQR